MENTHEGRLTAQNLRYVMPQVRLMTTNQKTSNDLLVEWEAFYTASNQRVLLIQGPSGIGKSEALRQIEHQLTLNKQEVYKLALNTLSGNSEVHLQKKPIAQCLHAVGWVPQSDKLRVLLLDGQDELYQTVGMFNLFRCNGLQDWTNLKVVITCRQEVLPTSYLHYFAPDDYQEGGLVEWQIQPLENKAQQDYVAQLLAQRDNKQLIEYKEYQDLVALLPKNLNGNPMLMRFCLKGISELKQQSGDKERTYTRYEIYRAALLERLDAEQRKYAIQGQRFDSTQETCRKVYAQEFALQLWLAGAKALPVLKWDAKLFPETVKLITDQEETKQILLKEHRHCQILAVGEEQEKSVYQFEHTSLQEFWVVYWLLSTLSMEPKNYQDCQNKFKDYGINPKLLEESGVLNFLQSGLSIGVMHGKLSSESLRERLHEMILETQHDKSLKDLGSLAITILVLVDESLSYRNYQGVEISGAILRGAICYGTDFRKANLQGVDGREANFMRAKLEGAKLENFTSGQLPMVPVGKSRDANCFAFSEDLSRMASGHKNGQICLWDMRTGLLLTTFVGSAGGVLSVSLSSNGKKVASGGEDKIVRLWEEGQSEARQMFSGHTEQVNAVSVSADGTRVASGSSDKTVRMWVEGESEARRVFSGHTEKVLCVSTSADGKTVASGSYDDTARIWIEGQSEALHVFTDHEDYGVYSVALSADGATMASGCSVGCIILRNTQSRKFISGFSHEGLLKGLKLSANGKTVVSGSDDRTVRVWVVGESQARRVFLGHTGPITCVSIDAAGRTVASGGEDMTARLWSVGELPSHRAFNTAMVTCVSLSANGKKIATASYDCTARQYEEGSESGQRQLSHAKFVNGVALSADGKRMVTGSSDNIVRLWVNGESKAREMIVKYQGKEQPVSVSVGKPRTVAAPPPKPVALRLKMRATRAQWREIKGRQTGGVNSVSLSDDGTTVAAGVDDRTVRIWEDGDSEARRIFLGHKGDVTSVSSSADGKTVASGSKDKTVRIWANEEKTIAPRILVGHMDSVTSVSLSSDGKLVASGSEDGAVIIWETDGSKDQVITERTYGTVIESGAKGPVILWQTHETRRSEVISEPGKLVFKVITVLNYVDRISHESKVYKVKFIGHTDCVNSVSISGDGKAVSSGSNDQTVRLWSVDTGDCLAVLEHPSSVWAVDLVQVNNKHMLVVGCENGMVFKWVSSNYQDWRLTWVNHQTEFYAKGSSLDGVQGISQSNFRLLYQLGSRGYPRVMSHGPNPQNTFFMDDWEVTDVHNSAYQLQLSRTFSAAKVVRLPIFAGQPQNLGDPITNLANALKSAFQLKPSLDYIDLSNLELDDIAALFLANAILGNKGYGAFPLYQLGVLVLSNNHITENGFFDLLDAINKRPIIKQLLIDRNWITLDLDQHKDKLCKLVEHSGLLNLDLSLNFIPKGFEIKEKHPITDALIRIYDHSGDKKNNHRDGQIEQKLTEVGRDTNDRKAWKCLLADSLFFSARLDSAKQRQERGTAAGMSVRSLLAELDSEDRDKFMTVDQGKVCLLANKQGGEHAYLVLEGVCTFGQRFLIRADLYAVNKAVKIVLSPISPSILQSTTKHGERVHCRTLSLTREEIKAVLHQMRIHRRQQGLWDFRLVKPDTNGAYNCLKWALQMLGAAGIHKDMTHLRPSDDIRRGGCSLM